MSSIDLRKLECAKGHNPINPTLNTEGVQCGVISPSHAYWRYATT